MSSAVNEVSSVTSEYRRWRRINIWIDRIILSVLLFLTVFIGSGLIDNFIFLEEGMGSIRYHSFDELLSINPDTVAWLTVDNTHIDHPVVRSRDNFDYLDKGFDGEFYAGGTLFMDKGNDSPENPYCIIHGHHMAGGAMFGDLDKFLDEDFFEENRTGTLLTPDYDYDLEIVAAGTFNAYDRNVFRAGGSVPLEYVMKNAALTRMQLSDAEGKGRHMLALSTCSDDMTDNRTMVFCYMTGRREHR